MNDLPLRYEVGEARWTPEDVDRNLSLLHATRRKRARRRVVASGALTAACGLLVAFWLLRPQDDLADESDRATAGSWSRSEESLPAEGMAKVTPGGSHHFGVGTVSFSDGSWVEMQTKEAQLHVGEVSAEQIRIELPRGSAQFEVTPQERRRFVVDARGLVITVLGTEFSVKHEENRCWVGVTRGKVSVKSRAEESILTAGEAAWFDVRQASSSSSDVEAGEPDASASGVEAAPKKLRDEFLRYHERAEYEEAYRLMKARPQVVGSSARESLRAADAARYSGHPSEAVVYLRRVQPTDPLAPAANFTLGRLFLHELARPAEAADAFALVRQISPGGPLTEDALFREIEAREKAGQLERAKSLAREYLDRYPKSGRRDAVVRRGGLD